MLVARLAELPANELLDAWESLSAVVAERARKEPKSLTSAPDGGGTVDGRLDALMTTRREFERAAEVAQRVSRRADAVVHLIAGAHHEAVTAYDKLSAVEIESAQAYPVEAGEYAAAALAASLGLSTPAARSMAAAAASLRRRHPRLLASSVAGDGAMRVAGMLADELAHLDEENALRVESALVGAGVHRRSHQAARERCRAVLRQMGLSRPVDPIAADQERGVWFEQHLDFDSLCRMTAVLDAYDAAALKAVIDDRARQLWENSARGCTPRAGAARADALVDLVLENSQVTTTINLTVPVNAAEPRADADREAVRRVHPANEAGRPDRAVSEEVWGGALCPGALTTAAVSAAGRPSSATPDAALGACSVPGVGVIPAHVVATLAAHVGTGFTATFTTQGERVTTLATTTNAYRPTAGIAKLVRERDEVCRFPYCTASAAHADLDHVVPFDQGGPTTATNLQALCRHHHRAKTHGGFTVTMTPGGDCTWTSPTGSQWLTAPGGISHRITTPVRAA